MAIVGEQVAAGAEGLAPLAGHGKLDNPPAAPMTNSAIRSATSATSTGWNDDLRGTTAIGPLDNRSRNVSTRSWN